MGRLMGFPARQLEDGDVPSILGLSVSEGTSLVLDVTEWAQVLGRGPVVLVRADHRPERCGPEEPLTFSGDRVWRMQAGDGLCLSSWPTEGGELWSVTDGVPSADSD